MFFSDSTAEVITSSSSSSQRQEQSGALINRIFVPKLHYVTIVNKHPLGQLKVKSVYWRFLATSLSAYQSLCQYLALLLSTTTCVPLPADVSTACLTTCTRRIFFHITDLL